MMSLYMNINSFDDLTFLTVKPKKKKQVKLFQKLTVGKREDMEHKQLCSLPAFL